MPVLRFPFWLRRESDLSALLTKQRLAFRLHALCAHFAGVMRETVTANPELFLPVFLLFVWQITAIAVKPRTLGFALLMTLLLLVYGYRVLGKTPWLRRLGWVSPRQGFWFYGVLAGVASGAGVWSIARFFHESLGSVPPPHRVLLASASGPMVEEMLFRGVLFWLIFELLRRGRVPKLAAVSATILVIAVGFAFSHTGRTASASTQQFSLGLDLAGCGHNPNPRRPQPSCTPSTIWCSRILRRFSAAPSVPSC